MADSIHRLLGKLQQLQSEISGYRQGNLKVKKSRRIYANGISKTKERLEIVKNTFNLK
jgi:hypothetical protein